MSSHDDIDSVVCGARENKFVVAAGHCDGKDGACSQYPVADLLDRNKAMRSEIAILQKLIDDKYDELTKLENPRDECSGTPEPTTTMTPAAAVPSACSTAAPSTCIAPVPSGCSTTVPSLYNATAPPACSVTAPLAGDAYAPAHVRKLKEVVRAIVELEEFTGSDGLNDDVIDEYIRHLERNYEQVLIFRPDMVHSLNAMPKEAVKEFLDARRVHDFEKVLFVLKKDGHYSLVLFNGANASFYHYDAANKRHSELAEQIILKLRRHFEAEQLVEVESNSQFGESSLFTVDSMMKIILTAEDDGKEGVSPVQVLNLPSQPDYLKIIIMSRYIVSKLSQIEQTIRGSA